MLGRLAVKANDPHPPGRQCSLQFQVGLEDPYELPVATGRCPFGKKNQQLLGAGIIERINQVQNGLP